ncbi:MAG TPA: hypothetical protein VJ986_02395 [Gaiellaceae bacterium]|nr:hypothetical protein [Gaiellaceae bacterium]
MPNLYPAFERQEVVIHSPRHARTFAELSDEEIAATATAWIDRKRAARAEGFGYVHALVNEGAAAGSSLPHSHSQLVWLREEPPALTAERRGAVAELAARADLAVARRDGLVAVVHPAGRLPYETLVASADGVFDLAAALAMLRELVHRLRVVEGAVPWNAWLHDGAEPHLELVPRLAIPAGIELGAGIHVNAVAPEDAAAALRAAPV